MISHVSDSEVGGDLTQLVNARRALAEKRDALTKGQREPVGFTSTAQLERQIAELDSQMAQLILRRAYSH